MKRARVHEEVCLPWHKGERRNTIVFKTRVGPMITDTDIVGGSSLPWLH